MRSRNLSPHDAPLGGQAGGNHKRRDLRIPGWLVLALGVAAAYAGGLQGAFVYDDFPNIVFNPSIKSFDPLWEPLATSLRSATAGRPLVNVSFALNYAISGLEPWSYHLFNILIHFAAACTLYGLARRGFAAPTLRGRFTGHADGLALATALLWALHPLQAHAVIYISQRMESMMGLFFLLTLYCAARGWEEGRRARLWQALAVASCLLGVGAKEVIAVAPLMVWLWDVLLRGAGPLETVRRAPLLYAGLLLCLGLLALQVATGATQQTGALDPDRGSLDYLLTQSQVLLHYLWLLFRPGHAAFDYVWSTPPLAEALPFLLLLAGLAGLALWGALRRRAWSYPMIWFFCILAPTSSVLPMMFPAAVYRLYLPLAGGAALFAAGGYLLCRRFAPSNPGRPAAIAVVVLAGVLGTGAALESALLSDPLTLWWRTAQLQPENPRAHQWVGSLVLQQGQAEASIPHFRRAVKLRPDYARARGALGRALLRAGKPREAAAALRQALQQDPGLLALHADLARAHLALERYAAAEQQLRIYLRHAPQDAGAAALLERVLRLQRKDS